MPTRSLRFSQIKFFLLHEDKNLLELLEVVDRLQEEGVSVGYRRVFDGHEKVVVHQTGRFIDAVVGSVVEALDEADLVAF